MTASFFKMTSQLQLIAQFLPLNDYLSQSKEKTDKTFKNKCLRQITASKNVFTSVSLSVVTIFQLLVNRRQQRHCRFLLGRIGCKSDVFGFFSVPTKLQLNVQAMLLTIILFNKCKSIYKLFFNHRRNMFARFKTHRSHTVRKYIANARTFSVCAV